MSYNLIVIVVVILKQVKRINMTKKEITSSDLMTFLEGFKTSMEQKIELTKETIEEKIDDKLKDIGGELTKINNKIDTNDEKNKAITDRMNKRLEALEVEMKNVARNKTKEVELNNLEKKSFDQPLGRNSHQPTTRRTTERTGGPGMMETPPRNSRRLENKETCTSPIGQEKWKMSW